MMGDDRKTGDDRVVADKANKPTRQHVLLTVLGRAPQPACYRLGGRQAEAKLAPLALYELLAQSDQPDCVPDRVVALCTSKAKHESWPLLETTLDGRCKTERVCVPTGEALASVDAYMEQAAKAIGNNADITVDVTHGFRHISFLTYMVALYVSALHGIRVRGAWYGMFRRDVPSPFFDLRPLLELPRWLHALQALNKTGNARPIAEILGNDAPKLADKHMEVAQDMARELTEVSEAYLAGLPLELGRQAGIIREQRIKPMRNLIWDGYRLPRGDALVNRIDNFLAPFVLDCVSGDGWKGKIPLTEHLLKTQACHIDDLLERGHIATALGLMNEWTVSWVLWAQEQTQEWLDYNKARRGAGNLLDAIEACGRDRDFKDRLSDEQRQLGEYWGKLKGLRNGYAHHGMRKQDLVGDTDVKNRLCEVREYWRDTLRYRPHVCLAFGKQPGRRVLVSPVGMRPGVLFSALRACKDEAGEPDLCLAICSHDTEATVQDAAHAADFAGAIKTILLEDPYGGVREIRQQAKAVRTHFVGAGEVFVNVTGGTTLMGLVAEAVASAAHRLACPVRRFGLIDRRPTAEQEKDPWQAGEPFWIDKEDGGGKTDND